MEQYIPKSVVLAEIEKLEELYCYGKSDGMLIAKSVFDSIKNIFNTLEVKEVDLKKEIDDFMAKEWEGVEEDDEPLYSMIKNDLTDVAEHFFELGMAVNNKAQKKE